MRKFCNRLGNIVVVATFLVFAVSTVAYAYSFIGPTGFIIEDDQDTTSGGGILHDILITPNQNVILCSAYNGVVNGAFSSTNGVPFGLVDELTGAGGASGQYPKDGTWSIFKQTPVIGCQYPIVEPIYASFSVLDGFIDPSSIDESSRIIVTEPYNEEIVSTTTQIGATIFISDLDYVDGMYFSYNLINNTLQNGIGGSALDAWNSAFNDFSFDLVPGLNVISTTTTFELNGQVNASWRVYVPNTTFLIGSFLPDNIFLSTTTEFTVTRKTGLDIAMSSSTSVLISSLITGTTTQSIIRCNPVDFDITTCLVSLFIPPQSVLEHDFNQLRDGFLSRWPLGYVTRFITIFSNTASSSLPVLRATVPPGIPGTGSSLVLDLNGVLDPFLNSTIGSFSNVSASSTQTLYEFTSYYWEIIVYLALGLYILRRILGLHLIPHGIEYQTDTTITPEVRYKAKPTGIIHRVSRVTKRRF